MQTEIASSIGENGGILLEPHELREFEKRIGAAEKLRVMQGSESIKLAVLKKGLGELMTLYTNLQITKDLYSATTKAVAEKAGLLPAVVRKFVKASAEDKFSEAKREVAQLSMVFEEFE